LTLRGPARRIFEEFLFSSQNDNGDVRGCLDGHMGRDMHRPDIPDDALSEQLEVYRTLSM
jgi:hypothetical protein